MGEDSLDEMYNLVLSLEACPHPSSPRSRVGTTYPLWHCGNCQLLREWATIHGTVSVSFNPSLRINPNPHRAALHCAAPMSSS